MEMESNESDSLEDEIRRFARMEMAQIQSN